MYELRWIKIIILMGVFVGFVGHFVSNNIELGLVIGLYRRHLNFTVNLLI